MKRTILNNILLIIIFYSLSITKTCHVLSYTIGIINIKAYAYTNSNSIKLVENPSDILVLVNKTNVLKRSYVPKDLTRITEQIMLKKEAAEALVKMLDAAKKNGIYLYCLSGYRSYDVQAQLYNTKLKERGVKYTEGYIAKPGSSEHQTGLAIDIINKHSNGAVIPDSFGTTKEGKWLINNSYRFGFILRYPKSKESITKFNYEPWHFRYVGVTASMYIKNKGLSLEEYLTQK